MRHAKDCCEHNRARNSTTKCRRPLSAWEVERSNVDSSQAHWQSMAMTLNRGTPYVVVASPIDAGFHFQRSGEFIGKGFGEIYFSSRLSPKLEAFHAAESSWLYPD